MSVADSLAQVRGRMKAACRQAGRSAENTTLVAVSKRQPDEKVLAAYAAGARDFGENYIQALIDRRERLAAQMPEAIWHFIGRVQTNKAKLIATADVVHGAGSARHVAALLRAGFGGQLFVQVNITNEAQKNGFAVDDLKTFMGGEGAASVDGLMAMGAVGTDPTPAFVALAALAADLVAEHEPARAKLLLSMGMSGDFESAIAAGATHVRVGTAIFGARDDGA